MLSYLAAHGVFENLFFPFLYPQLQCFYLQCGKHQKERHNFFNLTHTHMHND